MFLVKYCHLIKHGHNAYAYGMEECKIFLFNHVQGTRHTLNEDAL